MGHPIQLLLYALRKYDTRHIDQFSQDRQNVFCISLHVQLNSRTDPEKHLKIVIYAPLVFIAWQFALMIKN